MTLPVLYDLHAIFTLMTPVGFYQYFNDLTVCTTVSPFTTIWFDDDVCYHLEGYRHNYYPDSEWAN